MTSGEAMANVARRAVQLSIARDFARKNPGDEAGLDYAAVVQNLYDEAYRAYTDPFGTKTYA